MVRLNDPETHSNNMICRWGDFVYGISKYFADIYELHAATAGKFETPVLPLDEGMILSDGNSRV